MAVRWRRRLWDTRGLLLQKGAPKIRADIEPNLELRVDSRITYLSRWVSNGPVDYLSRWVSNGPMDRCTCSACGHHQIAHGSRYAFNTVMDVTPPPAHKYSASHAVTFHSLAGSFLAAQGFALAGHPERIDRYGGSTAFYRSERGIWLLVTFNPVDGSAAWMDCGRQWSWKGQCLFLSNGYQQLAKQFGLDVPQYYPMDTRDQRDSLMQQILADMKRTLPIIVSNVSLNDLLAIENEEPRGAAVMAARSFGANYSACVDISSFSE